jgi:hypothetical protein
MYKSSIIYSPTPQQLKDARESVRLEFRAQAEYAGRTASVRP